jgi:hypothetical protein
LPVLVLLIVLVLVLLIVLLIVFVIVIVIVDLLISMNSKVTYTLHRTPLTCWLSERNKGVGCFVSLHPYITLIHSVLSPLV